MVFPGESKNLLLKQGFSHRRRDTMMLQF